MKKKKKIVLNSHNYFVWFITVFINNRITIVQLISVMVIIIVNLFYCIQYDITHKWQ